MDLKEPTVSQPQTQEMVPAAQGPMELDPSLFAFVSGGAPFNTWGNGAQTTSNTSTTS